MINRQFFRSLLLQTLSALDARNFFDGNEEAIAKHLRYIMSTFLGIEDEEAYQEALSFFKDFLEKRELIDTIIDRASEGWNLKKMSHVDRNVLRLGVYELLYADKEEVPEKVAMNEAIELAKKFGGKKSGAFINGILGVIYRELGEPGKDYKGEKKTIPLEEMEIEPKVAAVIYSKDKAGVIRIGMVHDVFGYWTLSKGSIPEGMSHEEALVEKVKEETDWDIRVVKKLGENEYIAYPPNRDPVRKQVHYYLAESDYTEPKLNEEKEGLDDVRWFDLSEVSDLHMYDDVSRMLIQAIEFLTQEEG